MCQNASAFSEAMLSLALGYFGQDQRAGSCLSKAFSLKIQPLMAQKGLEKSKDLGLPCGLCSQTVVATEVSRNLLSTSLTVSALTAMRLSFLPNVPWSFCRCITLSSS